MVNDMATKECLLCNSMLMYTEGCLICKITNVIELVVSKFQVSLNRIDLYHLVGGKHHKFTFVNVESSNCSIMRIAAFSRVCAGSCSSSCALLRRTAPFRHMEQSNLFPMLVTVFGQSVEG